MPGIVLPPFPEDAPIQGLTIVDYALLKNGDVEQVDLLWKAATEQGFWYLKNHGVEDLADQMFDMGRETMELSFEEKMKFWQGNSGGSFGYKAAGATTVDPSGAKDTAEFINIAKDDAISYPDIVHRTYPSTVNAHMETVITPFVKLSTEINMTILEIFNDRLGLPNGTLAKFHTLNEPSFSEARCIKSPPSPGNPKTAIGAHTDFGSLSFLHNRLGGLQILLPGDSEWKYIKPIPRHAVCNVGDALYFFSGGILKSSLHRVTTPPLTQSHLERWSLVFFTRPGNSIPLRALVEDSLIITEVVNNNKEKDFDARATAGEWFSRRQSKWRSEDKKEALEMSRGTEHKLDAA